MSEGMLGNLPLSEIRGPRGDFEEKLAGADGSQWLAAFKRFLRRENPWELTACNFMTWKTIKLGTGIKTADDFRRAFKATGCRIGNLASDILDKPAFTASDTEMELDLFNVSVAELGFKDGATRRDIYMRALKLGLELCPNETGPQLRLQYQDQPRGEWLPIGMEPIRYSNGYLSIFGVGHDDGGLWLYGSYGSPVDLWHSSDRFVFCRRK